MAIVASPGVLVDRVAADECRALLLCERGLSHDQRALMAQDGLFQMSALEMWWHRSESSGA